MKFTEILEELKKGEKVTREKWEKSGDSCTINFISYDPKIGKCVFWLNDEYFDEFIWRYEDIIAEDWKLYEEPNQVWKPESNEKYYYISTRGDVAHNTFDKSLDKYRLSFKNCFKTREEAEHMAKKLKIINKLRELSNIKFNENQKEKWFIFYDFSYNKLDYAYNKYSKNSPFEVFFKTKQDCQKAIETIGEDNLKKYYFDVED